MKLIQNVFYVIASVLMITAIVILSMCIHNAVVTDQSVLSVVEAEGDFNLFTTGLVLAIAGGGVSLAAQNIDLSQRLKALSSG